MKRPKSKKTYPTPYGPRVLVELVAIEETSRGGVILAQQAQRQRLRGKVVAAGSVDYPPDYAGRTLDDLVGRHIVFMDFGIPEIDGDEFEGLMIVPEDAIVAILPE